MKYSRLISVPSAKFLLILLILHPVLTHDDKETVATVSASNSGGSILDIFSQLREESAALREEAQKIRQEGYSAMSKAYEVRDEAYDVKDSTYDASNRLETLIVQAFALLKSQTTTTGLHINDIMRTLTTVANKMDIMEGKIGEIEGKLVERTAHLDEEMKALVAEMGVMKTTVEKTKLDLSDKVDSSIALSTSVRDRQQVWMSEVRLISLYKTVDQNNGHPGYPNPIVTDGNFVINNVNDYVVTHCHTKSKAANNKLWINLGGYFKIHRIYIWNYRACCQEQLTGTHILADDNLVGVVVHNANFHDFLVPEDDPTYASTITLHQPLPRNIHVLEIQVWGSGPFSRDDIFV